MRNDKTPPLRDSGKGGFCMIIIRAVIREERLPYIMKALAEIGVYAMTCSQVRGRGSQRGITFQFRGGIFNVDFIPKVLVEIVVRDDQENMVVELILKGAQTGKEGDGRIFILPVIESYRVRTGEVEA